jgi:hypothetical protein
MYAAALSALRAQNDAFCIRTVSLEGLPAATNLSPSEAQAILSAGLGLMAVQHTITGTWTPSAQLGAQHGHHAAHGAKVVGLPMCAQLWLHLGGLASNTAAQDVIDYCNAWYDAVYNAGFTPGLWVSSNLGLTSSQLYDSLKFAHYAKMADPATPDVQTRSYQMVQVPGGVVCGVQVFADTAQNDDLGCQAQWLIATPIVPPKPAS